ncbi:MAG: hypothetical protein ABWZ66_13510 [Pyrinomonadaceae bacterium]
MNKLTKIDCRFWVNGFKLGQIVSLLLFIATSVLAQMPSVTVPPEEVVEK